jgi:hypothetical protein
MPTKLQGDYSRFPSVIREAFPYIQGEVCELRQALEVYYDLFVNDPERTQFFAEAMDPLLGLFQNLLQDELFLAIARLTDKDSRAQANLSLWTLVPAARSASDSKFRSKVHKALSSIAQAAAKIRKHRHKRIAHFDLPMTLNSTLLPAVTLAEIRTLVTDIEAFVNLFNGKFLGSTVLFDQLLASDFTAKAEVTAHKARAYTLLESEGVISHGEWRRRRAYK